MTPRQGSKVVKLEEVGILVPAIRLRLKYLKRVASLLGMKADRIRKDLAEKAARMEVLTNERQMALNSAAEYAASTIMNAMMTAEELGTRTLAEIEKMKTVVRVVGAAAAGKPTQWTWVRGVVVRGNQKGGG